MKTSNSRDSAHKRFKPTPKVESLHENMGLGKADSFGTPHPAHDYVFDNIKGGGKKAGPQVKTPGKQRDPGGVTTRKTGTTHAKKK